MQIPNPRRLELDIDLNNPNPTLLSPLKLSLVIAVYNKPDNLRLVLAACARQSLKEFEVIIADDGSGPAVNNVILAAQQEYSFSILHLWGEDNGWQKNRMLNHAMRSAKTDYLVFIDGDCLPSKDFLQDHWNEHEQNTMLMGRRVETSERWSRALTVEKIQSGVFERYGWNEWMDGLKGKSAFVEDGIRIPSRLLRKILLREARGLLGCNFSVSQKSLEAINGFDELYDGPGCGEDSDPEYRLSLLGVKGKSLRNLAIQYHIWHPKTKTSQACWDRFQEVKRIGKPQCKHGLLHIDEI